MSAGAVFSPCRTWRYVLTRDVVAPLIPAHPWEGGGWETVTFVGLNPSTADEQLDDPTIRRCLGFARDWGFTRLKMANLYAYRSTDPRALAAVPDPIGPENDCEIAKAVGGSDLVVCAWGVDGDTFAPGRARAVLELIADPHCLGWTKDRAPRHPLYVRADTMPTRFGELV